MNRRNRRRLIDGIDHLDIDPPIGCLESLVRYCDEIALWNRRMNLVGGTESEIVVRHILDSLSTVSVFQRLAGESESKSLCDVGSGAGFPGIPLAIALPNLLVALIERSERKASFLTNVRLLLELENVSVVETDQSPKDRTTQRYDIVTCRAFMPLDRALPTLLDLRAEGGFVTFFAASPPNRTPIPNELASIVISLDPPFTDAKRNLVVIGAPDDLDRAALRGSTRPTR